MFSLPAGLLLLIPSCAGGIEASVVGRAVDVIAPVVVSPSQYFEGNDGSWSSFELRVGTPAQNVRFFPGSSSTQTIVVLPEGCQRSTVSDCANLRGGLFNYNTSTTWEEVDLYGLGFENNLGYADNALFGYDTVGLGYQGSGGPTVDHTVIAGVAGTNFYTGLLGLNPRPTNFTDLNDPKPGFMTLLQQQNLIPSLSWSYTAGAKYRLKKVLGSLVIGGYDDSRFAASNISFGFASDQTRDLTVGLQTITTNATGSDVTLLSDGIDVLIDSSIAQIYLPMSVCQAFESAFGLTFDETAGLYFVDDALHSVLVSNNPTVTFVIGNTATGSKATEITLPYAAFDLEVAYPLVSNTIRYFPLFRAENETQYTLGRTFLQEAYLTVDYERGNFSVSPCVWNEDATEHIVPILSKDATASRNATVNASSASSSKSLSGGAIAGIVIGILLGLTATPLAIWFFVIRPRRKAAAAAKSENDYTANPPPYGAVEAGGKERNALPEMEAQGGDSMFSPNSSSLGKAELHSGQRPMPELATPREEIETDGNQIFEMQGSDVPEIGESAREFARPALTTAAEIEEGTLGMRSTV